ncbi:hypothetical protein KEH51_05075 [[Brevibacterium] frigoritolerans]|uniref:Uncharacterized protein n=1 Tax=Peribacillus frigoritolerans TaxID=450367 RepID=A0A941FHS0_9BACI|nr:hypothetical protein [Peribacillus frigoritolerans]
MEDDVNKVEITNYSYAEGIVNVTGKVTPKEDGTPSDIPTLIIPTKKEIYSSDYEESDYFKGIGKEFSISFELMSN